MAEPPSRRRALIILISETGRSITSFSLLPERIESGQKSGNRNLPPPSIGVKKSWALALKNGEFAVFKKFGGFGVKRAVFKMLSNRVTYY